MVTQIYIVKNQTQRIQVAIPSYPAAAIEGVRKATETGSQASDSMASGMEILSLASMVHRLIHQEL